MAEKRIFFFLPWNPKLVDKLYSSLGGQVIFSQKVLLSARGYTGIQYHVLLPYTNRNYTSMISTIRSYWSCNKWLQLLAESFYLYFLTSLPRIFCFAMFSSQTVVFCLLEAPMFNSIFICLKNSSFWFKWLWESIYNWIPLQFLNKTTDRLFVFSS